MDRRTFIQTGSSCAAYLTAWGSLLPTALRRSFAAERFGRVVADEPWGRIEKIGERVWGLISTPLATGPDVRRTLCNGGIVAGRNGVAVIEGLASDAGAEWMMGQVRLLTGRRPTHVILSHYHGDHSGGLGAYRRTDGATPAFVTTTVTRGRLTPTGAPAQILADAQLVDGDSPATVDLGGVKLTITPRAGHTPSDLTIGVDDPPVVFAGDLLWNGMFPNYRDAIPSVLSRSVREMLRGEGTRVPGHGPIPKPADATNYVAVIDLVEQAARRAVAAGTPMDAAAKEFSIPESLGKWVLFSDRYFLVALQAWEKELTAR